MDNTVFNSVIVSAIKVMDAHGNMLEILNDDEYWLKNQECFYCCAQRVNNERTCSHCGACVFVSKLNSGVPK